MTITNTPNPASLALLTVDHPSSRKGLLYPTASIYPDHPRYRSYAALAREFSAQLKASATDSNQESFRAISDMFTQKLWLSRPTVQEKKLLLLGILRKPQGRTYFVSEYVHKETLPSPNSNFSQTLRQQSNLLTIKTGNFVPPSPFFVSLCEQFMIASRERLSEYRFSSRKTLSLEDPHFGPELKELEEEAFLGVPLPNQTVLFESAAWETIYFQGYRFLLPFCAMAIEGFNSMDENLETLRRLSIQSTEEFTQVWHETALFLDNNSEAWVEGSGAPWARHISKANEFLNGATLSIFQELLFQSKDKSLALIMALTLHRVAQIHFFINSTILTERLPQPVLITPLQAHLRRLLRQLLTPLIAPNVFINGWQPIIRRAFPLAPPLALRPPLLGLQSALTVSPSAFRNFSGQAKDPIGNIPETHFRLASQGIKGPFLRKPFNSKEAIQSLSNNPEIRQLFQENNVRLFNEEYQFENTIAEHTETVLENYLAHFDQKLELSENHRALLLLYLTLHDIGKPLTRIQNLDRSLQEQKTLEILEKHVFPFLTNKESAFVKSLQTNPFGKLYLGKITSKEALTSLLEVRRQTGLPLDLVYKMMAAIHLSDAGAYPWLKESIIRKTRSNEWTPIEPASVLHLKQLVLTYREPQKIVEADAANDAPFLLKSIIDPKSFLFYPHKRYINTTWTRTNGTSPNARVFNPRSLEKALFKEVHSRFFNHQPITDEQEWQRILNQLGHGQLTLTSLIMHPKENYFELSCADPLGNFFWIKALGSHICLQSLPNGEIPSIKRLGVLPYWLRYRLLNDAGEYFDFGGNRKKVSEDDMAASGFLRRDPNGNLSILDGFKTAVYSIGKSWAKRPSFINWIKKSGLLVKGKDNKFYFLPRAQEQIREWVRVHEVLFPENKEKFDTEIGARHAQVWIRGIFNGPDLTGNERSILDEKASQSHGDVSADPIVFTAQTQKQIDLAEILSKILDRPIMPTVQELTSTLNFFSLANCSFEMEGYFITPHHREIVYIVTIDGKPQQIVWLVRKSNPNLDKPLQPSHGQMSLDKFFKWIHMISSEPFPDLSEDELFERLDPLPHTLLIRGFAAAMDNEKYPKYKDTALNILPRLGASIRPQGSVVSEVPLGYEHIMLTLLKHYLRTYSKEKVNSDIFKLGAWSERLILSIVDELNQEHAKSYLKLRRVFKRFFAHDYLLQHRSLLSPQDFKILGQNTRNHILERVKFLKAHEFYRDYPLFVDDNLFNLTLLALRLVRDHEEAVLIAVGQSPAWLTKIAQLLDQNKNRFIFPAMSRTLELGLRVGSRFRPMTEDDFDTAQIQMISENILPKEKHYRIYLRSIGLTPELFNNASKKNKEVVIIDNVFGGNMLRTFVTILLRWAEELDESPEGPLAQAFKKSVKVIALTDPSIPYTKDFKLWRMDKIPKHILDVPIEIYESIYGLMEAIGTADHYLDRLLPLFPSTLWKDGIPLFAISREGTLIYYNVLNKIMSWGFLNQNFFHLQKKLFSKEEYVLLPPGTKLILDQMQRTLLQDPTFQDYPLASERSLGQLSNMAEEIIRFPPSLIISLGQSPAWLMNMVRLKSSKHIIFQPAFSRQRPLTGRFDFPVIGFPRSEMYQSYKKYLESLGLTPQNIVKKFQEEGMRTQLWDYAETGSSLIFFTNILFSWAQEIEEKTMSTGFTKKFLAAFEVHVLTDEHTLKMNRLEEVLDLWAQDQETVLVPKEKIFYHEFSGDLITRLASADEFMDRHLPIYSPSDWTSDDIPKNFTLHPNALVIQKMMLDYIQKHFPRRPQDPWKDPRRLFHTWAARSPSLLLNGMRWTLTGTSALPDLFFPNLLKKLSSTPNSQEMDLARIERLCESPKTSPLPEPSKGTEFSFQPSLEDLMYEPAALFRVQQ